ncbi:hypothetical protein ACIQRK_32255 [Streptomyces anulatus]
MIHDLTAHAPVLGLAAVCFLLASLLDAWDHRRRRHIERRTRPGTAEQDAAAIAAQAIRENWKDPR